MFFKLQYLYRISTQIEKEIRDFLKHYEIKTKISHSTFNIEYKNRQFVLHSVGVYYLTCSCDHKYICQTKRNLITRNFDSPIILDRGTCRTKLHVKETLHFAKRQPQLNADSQSLSLILFNA